jgi:hypothetical protein
MTFASFIQIAKLPLKGMKAIGAMCVGLAQALFNRAMNALIGAFGLAFFVCAGCAIYVMLIKPWL